MKLFLVHILIFITAHTLCNAQSYLAYANESMDLIDTNYATIKHIPKGDALFLVSLENAHGYYNVIHIKSNKEGFVPRKHIQIERVIPQIEENIFTSVQTSDAKDPILKVYNNSKMPMILKINNVHYDVAPKERKNIHLKKGRFYYRVSTSNVEPYYGTETLDDFRLYEWEFYIGDM